MILWAKPKCKRSSQARARPSPIFPHHLSLRILSKQDPSLATVCCSISSFCVVCAPLLPFHHLYPEGLLWSLHHQYWCFLLYIWDSCSNLAVWLRGVCTAGDRNMLISQLAGIFNPLFLSETRGCLHTRACKWVERDVAPFCHSLASGPVSTQSYLPLCVVQCCHLTGCPHQAVALATSPIPAVVWLSSRHLSLWGGCHWGDPKLSKWTWTVLIASDWDACVPHSTYQVLKSHSGVLPVPNFDFVTWRHDPWVLQEHSRRLFLF